MGKKLMFIFNPLAGKSQIKSKLMEIVDIFVKNGFEVTIYPTQGFMDACDKAEHLPEGYDVLVCSGGDGTLDEIVTGIMKKGVQIPIGYIPAGSTNDFANSLKLPRNMLQAALVACTGYPFPCDVGAFNDDSFVYIAAFGIFTDVSYLTKQEMKNVLGHVAYVLEGMKRLYSIRSYNLKFTYSDQVIEGDFMFGMITNSKSVGGFKSIVGKNVVFDDGLFEVTLIQKPRNAFELQEILAATLIQEINTQYMYSFRTDHLFIESEESIPWTLDGEFGGDHQKVEILNKKRAIKIMVSANHLNEIASKDQFLL